MCHLHCFPKVSDLLWTGSSCGGQLFSANDASMMLVVMVVVTVGCICVINGKTKRISYTYSNGLSNSVTAAHWFCLSLCGRYRVNINKCKPRPKFESQCISHKT